MRISGTAIADKIYDNLHKRVGELRGENITPHLTALVVGENPASIAYVKIKQTKGEAIGAKVTIKHFDETVTTEELVRTIKEVNADPLVHGILIQRPLPSHIDVAQIEAATDPQKDVDGFHPDSPYTLPLPLAVVTILDKIFSSLRDHAVAKQSHIKAFDAAPDDVIDWLKSKHIVVLGKGQTGGGPILAYLKKLHLHPALIDSKTANAQELLKRADIIISATGKENMITPQSIKQGVILIGVGILEGTNGKLHGDYESDKIKDIASFYTPTPGGVGPVNVAKLMENLITATEKQTTTI